MIMMNCSGYPPLSYGNPRRQKLKRSLRSSNRRFLAALWKVVIPSNRGNLPRAEELICTGPHAVEQLQGAGFLERLSGLEF